MPRTTSQGLRTMGLFGLASIMSNMGGVYGIDRERFGPDIRTQHEKERRRQETRLAKDHISSKAAKNRRAGGGIS